VCLDSGRHSRLDGSTWRVPEVKPSRANYHIYTQDIHPDLSLGSGWITGTLVVLPSSWTALSGRHCNIVYRSSYLKILHPGLGLNDLLITKNSPMLQATSQSLVVDGAIHRLPALIS
jgi:hypothetical protein